MDFHQLRYFLEVARQEHMGKAARVLAVSQSALSHAISGLERDLGVSLFNREGRRIFINNSGRILLERGERLLREKLVLEEDLQSQGGEIHGSIRMAAPIAINSQFLGPAWAKVSAIHPKLRAEILSLRSIDIVAKTIAGEVDFGICFGPQAHALIASSPLARFKLVPVVSRKVMPAKRLKAKDATKFLESIPASLPMGLLGFGAGETHPFFERYRFKPRVALLYDNYEVALAFITAQPAWALLPDWTVAHFSGQIQAIGKGEIFEPLEITAVWPKNRFLSPVVKLIEDELNTRFDVRAK